MIETSKSKVVYLVGSGKVFAFPYRFFDASDIEVWLETENGSSVQLVSGLDYEVETKEDYSGGANITLKPGTAALPSLPAGRRLTIMRVVPYTQKTSLPLNGKLPSTAVETQLDRIVAGLQQLRELAGRCVKVSPTSKTDPDDLIGELTEIAKVPGKIFLTVGRMTEAAGLVPGQHYRTTGFHTSGDGGGCDYLAVSREETPGNFPTVCHILFLSAVRHWKPLGTAEPEAYSVWDPEGSYEPGDVVSADLVVHPDSDPLSGWAAQRRYFECVKSQSPSDVYGVPYSEASGVWLFPLPDVDRVNVKQLGAKGDGFSDDTAAVQAAFDYPTMRGTVFPAGVYLVRPPASGGGFWKGLLSEDCIGPRYCLRCPSDIGIEGDGATIKVASAARLYSGIFGTYANTAGDWTAAGLYSFRIRSLTVDENAEGNTGYNAEETYIEDGKTESGWTRPSGVPLGNIGRACAYVVSANIAKDVTLRDCTFIGYGKNLVVLRGCADVKVESCRFGFELKRTGAAQYDNSLLAAWSGEEGSVLVQNCVFENLCDFSPASGSQIGPGRALLRPFCLGAVEAIAKGATSIRNNTFRNVEACVNLTGSGRILPNAKTEITGNSAQECMGLLSIFNMDIAAAKGDDGATHFRNVSVLANTFQADGGFLRFLGAGNTGSFPYRLLWIKNAGNIDYDIRGLSVNGNEMIFTGNPAELSYTAGKYYLGPRGVFHLWNGYHTSQHKYSLQDLRIEGNRVSGFPAPMLTFVTGSYDDAELENCVISDNEFLHVWAYDAMDNSASAAMTDSPYLTEKHNAVCVKKADLGRIRFRRNKVSFYDYGKREPAEGQTYVPAELAGAWMESEFGKSLDEDSFTAEGGGLTYVQARERSRAARNLNGKDASFSSGSALISSGNILFSSGGALLTGGSAFLTSGIALLSAGSSAAAEVCFSSGSVYILDAYASYKRTSGYSLTASGADRIASAGGGEALYEGDEVRKGSSAAVVVSAGFVFPANSFRLVNPFGSGSGTHWLKGDRGAEVLSSGSANLGSGNAAISSGSALAASGRALISSGSAAEPPDEEMIDEGTELLVSGYTMIADGAALVYDGTEGMLRGRELAAHGNRIPCGMYTFSSGGSDVRLHVIASVPGTAIVEMPDSPGGSGGITESSITISAVKWQ